MTDLDNWVRANHIASYMTKGNMVPSGLVVKDSLMYRNLPTLMLYKGIAIFHASHIEVRMGNEVTMTRYRKKDCNTARAIASLLE